MVSSTLFASFYFFLVVYLYVNFVLYHVHVDSTKFSAARVFVNAYFLNQGLDIISIDYKFLCTSEGIVQVQFEFSFEVLITKNFSFFHAENAFFLVVTVRYKNALVVEVALLVVFVFDEGIVVAHAQVGVVDLHVFHVGMGVRTFAGGAVAQHDDVDQNADYRTAGSDHHDRGLQVFHVFVRAVSDLVQHP